ncbi:hypothetical protein ABMA28_006039 [Loxostege sticticalis]|uniref:Uncharacterized protein n=1 Tax=Loxostege sticticalis TaxID=481309 RepID=A0ABD0SM63_LOXSC
MDKLQFDKMEVNTDLAKEYFKKNNHQFPKDPGSSDLKSEKDGACNTIFYGSCPEYEGLWIPKSHDLTIELDWKFRRLAEEVEKNAETFCQIEFMVRKIPVDEVRNYDIKLIVQNLLLGYRARWIRRIEFITMDESTPLFALGFVVQTLKENTLVNILCTKNTAAVCHFFVELCYKVGLDSVKIFNVEFIHPDYAVQLFDRDSCVGVITEHADVDSAVDTFVRTTIRYPWRLRLVLVAESAWGAWEAAAARAGAADGCALPLAAPGAAPVPADAYRTARELLARLRERGAAFASLWAGDVAAALELAHQAPAAVVWLNGYGAFDGPPQASQAIYTQVSHENCMERVPIECTPADLLQKQEAWANMTFEQRRGIVLNVTDEFSVDELNDEGEKTLFTNLRSALRNIKSENFVDVVSDRICMGLTVPRKVILISSVCKPNYYFTSEEISKYLATHLTVGSAIVFAGGPLNKYFDRLASRIPITKRNNGSVVVDALPVWRNAARTKVIWMSFGTIFAN